MGRLRPCRVVERGYSTGYGNTVRVYQTKLDDRANCTGARSLSRTSPALGKTCVVDLSSLAVTNLPEPKQPQPTPLLDNFEGIALGPRLPDGRPTLLMVSDDNGRADQVARLLVLTLPSALAPSRA